MARLNFISLFTVIVIGAIALQVENALAVKSPRHKSDCKNCIDVCKGGQKWATRAVYCARCYNVCDTKNDPWLKMSMMKKQMRNGTDTNFATMAILVPEAAPVKPTDNEGQAISNEATVSPIDEIEQSGIGWWGRR